MTSEAPGFPVRLNCRPSGVRVILAVAAGCTTASASTFRCPRTSTSTNRYVAPVVAVEDDLMEAENVAGVFDLVHRDLEARAAAARRWRVNVGDHFARVHDQLIRVLEPDEGDRLVFAPQNLQ